MHTHHLQQQHAAVEGNTRRSRRIHKHSPTAPKTLRCRSCRTSTAGRTVLLRGVSSSRLDYGLACSAVGVSYSTVFSGVLSAEGCGRKPTKQTSENSDGVNICMTDLQHAVYRQHSSGDCWWILVNGRSTSESIERQG